MLKYTESIYLGKIDQLTNYISMLNEHMEQLEKYKNELKIFWNDVEGERLADSLQMAVTSTRNQLCYLQKQLGFYQRMVREYHGASADVQQKIESVFQTMSNIGDVVSLAGM